ncbi:MAG TPA: CDP-alcohol phosphatidyltransferase family protein [Thermoanaerobaculia bacterium]|nr:CDP-alcohol phosphatidyltransferase family protein [Thermoanaerobaculia bacterium]
MDNLQLSWFARLPHATSCFRIVAGLVVILLYDPTDTIAFSIAVSIALLGEISDHIDGFLARKLGVASEVGYVLDGLGDRALYSALILSLFLRHDLNKLAVWLLVFGQILIYGLRLMHGEWHAKVKTVRGLHVLHWTFMRLWILTYVVQDAGSAWSLSSAHLVTSNFLFLAAQKSLAWIAVVLLYYAVHLKVSEFVRQTGE